VSADSDPAVILLARHLGTIAAEGNAAQAQLRQACMEAAAEMARESTLVALARRNVAYDQPAKNEFHVQARKVLRALAGALHLEPDSFAIRSNLAGIAVSGEVMLHGEDVYVQVSTGCMGRGHEVMFRRVAGRDDLTGGANHWASIEELVEPDRFAARIARALGLDALAADALSRLI
jgi:hypothetical protein